MSDELAKWAPGMPLSWALISLAIGAMIFGYIVVRIWGEYRAEKVDKVMEEGEEA